jgi:hypothetical protein
LLPEVASEDADRLVLVDALLVEVEQQVEMEVDDAVVDVENVYGRLLGRWRSHRIIIAP